MGCMKLTAGATVSGKLLQNRRTDAALRGNIFKERKTMDM